MPALRRLFRSRGAEPLLAALAAAALASLALRPPPLVPIGDERDYLRAAVHLARDGRLAHAPVDVVAPRDAYREPGYPAVLAALLRATRAPLPASESELGLRRPSPLTARVRVLGLALLTCTAAAAAAAARAAGVGRTGAWMAAATVAASPALRQAAQLPCSEGLAAALVATAGAALAWAARGRQAAVAVAAVAIGGAVLVRGACLAIVVAGAAIVAVSPGWSSWRRRVVALAAFVATALAPAALWGLRNSAVTGQFVLADRGGAVLWTRVELDRQVARAGLLPALAAWTPLAAVQRAAESRWPDAQFARYAWRDGDGNYFTRALRAWRAARRPPADPLAADRALGRAALREFARHPAHHAATTVAVGWRGLFAERSPAALHPVDLTFALGLLLAAAVGVAAVRAARRRDLALAALLAPLVALFAFHALATEFLPRFGVPALPLAWAALAVVVGGRARAATPAESGA